MIVRRRLLFWLPILALGIFNLFAQSYYVQRSRATTPGGFTEVPYISSARALDTLSSYRTRWSSTVFTDTAAPNSARIQAYYVNPSAILFLTSDDYDAGAYPAGKFCRVHPCLFPAYSLFAAQDARAIARLPLFHESAFDFRPGSNTLAYSDRFAYDMRAIDSALKPNLQLIEAQNESILNGWPTRPPPIGPLFRVIHLNQVENRLVFIPGSLGSRNGQSLGRVSLYAFGPDTFFSDKVFAAIGRYLLFRVIAPSHRVRLEVSITSTPLGGGGGLLPPAAAVGQRRVRLAVLGRGAARVFSSVLTLREMNGMKYVGLDLGEDARPLPQPPRSGLMLLFGRGVRLDPRNVTLFARDISLIDDSQYKALRPPFSVSHFPADLANPDLEFSGIYENGWASERSRFVLRGARQRPVLRLRGLIPLIGNPSFVAPLCVWVDGFIVGCKDLPVGYFDLKFEVRTSGRSKHDVELRYAKYQVLPGGDGKPVGMKLQSLGFESASAH